MANITPEAHLKFLCAEYERLDARLAELIAERDGAAKALADARLSVRVCEEMMQEIEEEIAVASSTLDT